LGPASRRRREPVRGLAPVSASRPSRPSAYRARIPGRGRGISAPGRPRWVVFRSPVSGWRASIPDTRPNARAGHPRHLSDHGRRARGRISP